MATKNPRVFLDITIDNNPVGRMVVELRADVVPKTAENYRALCTGELGRNKQGIQLHYKGTLFYRIVPDFMCLGGDIVSNNGTGGVSIYKGNFEDENFTLTHDRGTLSMLNADSSKNANNSQFFISSIPAPWLDGKHVVFGKVVEGLEVLDKIEAQGQTSGVPKAPVKIADCGELI